MSVLGEKKKKIKKKESFRHSLKCHVSVLAFCLLLFQPHFPAIFKQLNWVKMSPDSHFQAQDVMIVLILLE